MAETKKTVTVEEPERVEVFVPRSYAADDPNFFVSVNGVNYILPRGTKQMVLPEVAYEIERAAAAQDALDRRIDEMLEASK